MADNTQLNLGSGGDVIKTEDLGAYKLAVSKIYLGAPGVNDGPVTASNPFPVAVANFPSVQAVTASAMPLPDGAATAANQPAFGTAGSPAADVLTVQGGLGMIPLKVDGSAEIQPVSGSVSVNNFPAVQAVSVANFPATQPISGAVSVANFPATQPVSGAVSVANFPATQPVSGAVSVANFPATQPISGAVSVSGAVTTTANLNVAGAAVASNNPVPMANVVALPAGTNTIGAVIAQVATGVVFNGAIGLTPKFAAISASSVGDNTVVAAVAGKKIRVLKYTILTSGPVAAKFRSASVADLTGSMTLAANSGVGGAFCPVGLFETAAGDALNLNLSGAAGVAGHLTYIEV